MSEDGRSGFTRVGIDVLFQILFFISISILRVDDSRGMRFVVTIDVDVDPHIPLSQPPNRRQDLRISRRTRRRYILDESRWKE